MVKNKCKDHLKSYYEITYERSVPPIANPITPNETCNREVSIYLRQMQKDLKFELVAADTMNNDVSDMKTQGHTFISRKTSRAGYLVFVSNK